MVLWYALTVPVTPPPPPLSNRHHQNHHNIWYIELKQGGRLSSHHRGWFEVVPDNSFLFSDERVDAWNSLLAHSLDDVVAHTWLAAFRVYHQSSHKLYFTDLVIIITIIISASAAQRQLHQRQPLNLTCPQMLCLFPLICYERPHHIRHTDYLCDWIVVKPYKAYTAMLLPTILTSTVPQVYFIANIRQKEYILRIMFLISFCGIFGVVYPGPRSGIVTAIWKYVNLYTFIVS